MNEFGLAEISALWQWWNECVRRAKLTPWSPVCQVMSAKAQATLVMAQAEYFGSIRP